MVYSVFYDLIEGIPGIKLYCSVQISYKRTESSQ